MFSRARRMSRIQAKQKPEISQEPLPVSPLGGSISLSTRSDSPALPSPLLPWADANRPISADGIDNRKSMFITGPPVLPPIRLASAQELIDNGDTGSLHLDFTKSIAAVDSTGDNTSWKGKPRTQRSSEDPMRPRSIESAVAGSPMHAGPRSTSSAVVGSPTHAALPQLFTASAVAVHAEQPKIPTAIAVAGSPMHEEPPQMPIAGATTSIAPRSSSLINTDTALRARGLRSSSLVNLDTSLQSARNADSSLPNTNPTPSSVRAPGTFRTASPVSNSVRAPSTYHTASPAPIRAPNTYRAASPAPSSPIAPGTFRTASPVSNSVRAPSTYRTASPAPTSRTANPASNCAKVQDSLPLRERDSIVGNVAATYITQDPMFPRSTESSPLLPRFPQPAGRDSSDGQGRRTVSGDSDVEHKRKSRRVGKAVTGPTMVVPSQSNDMREQPVIANPSNVVYESPKMEASMFPSFKPPQSTPQSTPIMDREFIDSRDRPYSQAKPKSLNSSATPNFTRPGYQAMYNNSSSSLVLPAQTQQKPTSAVGKSASLTASSPSSTIGISFESTSAAFPAPQLVSTRPKNAGAVSTVAGVQVPTHHTSGVRLQDTSSLSSKTERRRTKLLNPMALLNRRKSAVETTVPGEEGRRASTAQARQKTVGIDKIPEDFDPRIKGKIVHDFSAPRAARTFGSPTSYTQDSPVSPMIKSDPVDNRIPRNIEPSVVPGARKSVHTPVFHEHLEHEPPVAQQAYTGGIGAERRENKDFLARFSQQSSASTVSQESAILPPFARRSQVLDPHQAATWRDDDGSWSSGRDSGGGRSSTGPPGDRESGMSSFSAVSPITRSSDSMQNGAFYGFETARGNFSPVSPPLDRKGEYMDYPPPKSSTSPEAKTRTPSVVTARPMSTVQGKSIEQEPAAKSNTSPPRLATAKREGEGMAKRKSNASRFSFQMGATEGDEEKALEEKFRESGVFPNNTSAGADNEDDDYFDEDAMNDMDEMEMQLQNDVMTPQALDYPPDIMSVQHDQQFAVPTNNVMMPTQSTSSAAGVPAPAQHILKSTDPANNTTTPTKRDLQSADPPSNVTIPAEHERQSTDSPSSITIPAQHTQQSTTSPSKNPAQHKPTNSPTRIIIPAQHKQQSTPSSAVASTPSSVPTSAIDGRKASVDGFFYSGDIPYVPNERELTYAEHPVFQTHSALADSRRESYQSNFLDSYLNASPTSPSRKDDRSVTSNSTGTGSARDRSRQGSIQSVRALSYQVSSMSPLPEIDSPAVQTPRNQSFTTDQRDFVDSALGSFKFSDGTVPGHTVAGRARADSDTDVKPQWTRTANLWKRYTKDEPLDAATPIAAPLTAAPLPVKTDVPTSRSVSRQNNQAPRGAYMKGVHVRKPSGGTRQSRLSMASNRLESIKQQNEDMYFDDGQFEEETNMPTRSQTDEASIDHMPVPDRGQKDYRASNLGMIGVASDSPYPSMPTNEATRQRDNALLLQDLPLIQEVEAHLIPQRNPSEDAKRYGTGLAPAPVDGEPHDLQAYHQALADAANRAAAEGRFVRQASIAHDTLTQSAEVAAPAEAATPGKMAFDFGFDAVGQDDWTQDNEDDDIVAAANAEALAFDDDGFYGSEFGFYANARPGAGAEVEATNGGFFGEDGDDGLTRKRSVKEPNLTPITERSEFSTRNSFINLHGLVNGAPAAMSSALSTPSLARMPINEFSENDITTFEQLKQLRKNAFGSSDISLSQRSSPTSQHFPTGSVPMMFAYSTGSSSSGDRLVSSDSPERGSLVHETHSQTHSRQGSGTDTAVTYVREQENGQPRWIVEKRRTSGLGQVEVNREVVADGWI